MRLLPILFFALLSLAQPSQADTKTVYGFIEKATLVEKNITLPAKLDTGAKSSSLHAINIKKIKIDGESYVEFTVPHPDGEAHFVCKYFGKVSIKPRSQEAERLVRPVVWMKIKLGNQEQTVRVNLTDRGRFMYPLLLGRQAIIAFHGLVDPSEKYLSISPTTQKPEPK